jgi:hypothetical protein
MLGVDRDRVGIHEGEPRVKLQLSLGVQLMANPAQTYGT